MWIGFLAAVIAVGILLLIFFRFRRKRFSEKDKTFFRNHWTNIEKTFETDLRKAVLDADALFNWALDRRFGAGDVGDKLKTASSFFSDIDDIWKAHKLRNRIAHEIGGGVSKNEAENALRAFRKAFHDLGL